MNEEYLDASLIITVEWIDKNLVWETGKIRVAENSTSSSEVPTTTPTTTTSSTSTATASTTSAQSTTTSSDQENKNEEKKKKPDEVRTNQVNINSIRAEKSQVWIPEIEILNRADDFSHIDEKQRPVKISSNGKVRYTRAYRMRAMLSSAISFYPYDVQVN